MLSELINTGPTLLALSAIVNDGGTQMRAGMNADTVKEYEDALTDAEVWPFPPVVVYHDGAKYWLADGFHRLNAAHRSGKFQEIPADIKAGTRRDAVLFAAGANASHGLRRTNDDKNRAVKTLLEDDEWSKWSDREIARRCAVDNSFVSRLRAKLTVDHPQSDIRTGADGRTINTANIGANRSQPPAMLAVWELQATVREVYAQVYGGNPEPYATRDMRTGAQMRAGRFWLLCTQSLPANQFHLSDLAQAINNVAAQVEAQAQAPVVTMGDGVTTMGYVVDADDPAEPERSTAPTAHQSEPIQYAEIWKLQSIVRGLSMSPTRGFGAFDAKTMAELLRRAAANRSADDFWNACIESIQKQRLAHRTNDLVQAINNYASHIETKYDVRSDDRLLPAWAADAAPDEETQEPEDRQQQLVELLIDATRDEYAEWILAAAEGKHPRIFIMCENLADQKQYFGCDLKAALRQVSQWRYDTDQVAPANPRPVPLMSQRAATPEPVMATVAQTVADVVEVHGEPAPVAVETVEVTTPVSQRADYESDEWYTPQEYIDAAKAVMGAIDLDPASSEMAQTVVRAGVYLTRFDDGLAQVRWIHQRIWLNPPYSNPAPWVEKLVREHQAGPFCTEAIVLVNNATETSWFQLLLERFPVCLPARRLAFWRHDHANVGARQGQAFFYLGPNVAKFQEVFSQFGPILRRLA